MRSARPSVRSLSSAPARWRGRTAPRWLRSPRRPRSTLGALKEDWNGFSVLHTAASRVAALELSFVPGEGGLSATEMGRPGALDVLFLLGADEIDVPPGAFTVYIGSNQNILITTFSIDFYRDLDNHQRIVRSQEAAPNNAFLSLLLGIVGRLPRNRASWQARYRVTSGIRRVSLWSLRSIRSATPCHFLQWRESCTW